MELKQIATVDCRDERTQNELVMILKCSKIIFHICRKYKDGWQIEVYREFKKGD